MVNFIQRLSESSTRRLEYLGFEKGKPTQSRVAFIIPLGNIQDDLLPRQQRDFYSPSNAGDEINSTGDFTSRVADPQNYLGGNFSAVA